MLNIDAPSLIFYVTASLLRICGLQLSQNTQLAEHVQNEHQRASR